MTKLHINIGDTANDRTGDPLRTAFEKVNSNFDELYARTGDDIQIPALTGNNGKILSVSNGALSWATVTNDRLINGSNEVVLDEAGILNLPQCSAVGAAVIQPDSASFGVKLISNGYTWAYGTDGSLTLPSGLTFDGRALYNPNNGGINIWDGPGDGPYNGEILLDSDGVTLTADNETKFWNFDNSGTLKLPESVSNTSSFTATTSSGLAGDTKEFPVGGSVDTVTTSWTATGGGIVGTANITNVTVGLSFTFVTFDQSFTATGPITFTNSGIASLTTSGAIQQRNTRTVTQGNTTVNAEDSGVIFSASAWQTGFKLVIMVETRLDGNVDDVDHTQICEAVIAANYNSNAEPVMSVYGLTYTSPDPLATFTVQRTGYTSAGTGTIEVVATNVQTQYNLQVSVQAVQFGSFYD